VEAGLAVGSDVRNRLPRALTRRRAMHQAEFTSQDAESRSGFNCGSATAMASQSARDCPGNEACEDDGVRKPIRIPTPSTCHGRLKRTQAMQGNTIFDEHRRQKERDAQVGCCCRYDPGVEPVSGPEPRREKRNRHCRLNSRRDSSLIDVQNMHDVSRSELDQEKDEPRQRNADQCGRKLAQRTVGEHYASPAKGSGARNSPLQV
jgi:hypothetical protein